MPRTNITLSGRHHINAFSLLGINLDLENNKTHIIGNDNADIIGNDNAHINPVIEKIKNNITEMFLIPLCSEKIDIVDKNSIFIDIYLKYLKNLPDDYTYYIRLLEYIQKNLSDIKELKNIRKNQRNQGDLRVKLFRVDLSPEYLIYYSIYGKSKKKQ